MKKIIAVAAMLIATNAFGRSCEDAGELVAVERLLPNEIQMIKNLEEEISRLKQKLETLKVMIANSHDMKGETWMEWQTWTEFDGNYILKRYQNLMEE